MIEKDTFNVVDDYHGAKALIYIDGKIIVIRRDNNTIHYPLLVDIPGGRREEGESPFDTLKREVFEELGITLVPEDIIFSKRYPSVINPEVEAYMMATRPLHITEDTIQFGNEGLEYFLITPHEYASLNDGVKPHQERVKEYLNKFC